MYRLRNAAAAAMAGLLFSVLSACGGGGGGGGGSNGGDGNNTPPPPAAAVDTPNSFLPTSSDIRWTYRDDFSGISGIEVKFEAPFDRNGHVVHTLVYPNGGKEYFVTDAGKIGLEGIYLPFIDVGNGSAYTGDIHFDTPVSIFGSDWLTGTHNLVNGAGKIDVSNYGLLSLQYSGSIHYSKGPTATKLGLYDHQVVDIDLTVSVKVEGQVVTFPYRVLFHLVDGIGIVERLQGGTQYKLTSVSGLDDDEDGVLNAHDAFPNDGNRWEVSPLYATDDGIALTSVPSFDRLEQTVTVMQGNGPAPVAWTASADQSWLTATQESGGRLHLVANPVGLAPDALYEATVTVQSDSAEVSAPATIRVGLWVGTVDAPASTSIFAGLHIAVDPVRPYVYVEQGSDIGIYNIYTQAVVGTIPAPANGSPFLVSSDGASLYFNVLGTSWRAGLATPHTLHQLSASVTDIAYARPQGQPVLVDMTGRFLDAQSGEEIPYVRWIDFNVNNLPLSPHASLQGNRLCASGNPTPALLRCHELRTVNGKYRDIRSVVIGEQPLTTFAWNVAMSNSGDAVYVADGFGVFRYDPEHLGSSAPLPTLSNNANSVDVDADDNIYAGYSTVVRFDRNLTQSGVYPLGAQMSEVSISGDGGVLLSLVGSTVYFHRTY